MIKRKFGKFFVVLVLIVIIFASLMCNRAGSEGKGPDTAEKLTIGICNDGGNVTIWGGGAYSPWILNSVCEKLVGPNPYGNELKPVLAEYVKPVTDDNKVWEIKLKKGVKWHDGTPLTSEDVKFTIDYNREGPSNNRYSHHTSVVPRLPGDGITIIDELTLRVTGAFPLPFFDREPCAELPIVQKAQWKDIKDPRLFTGKSIGTGPYKLVDYKVGEYYKLEANMDYHMGTPLVKKLDLVVIRDLSTMFTALKSGEIDGAARSLPPEMIDDWSNDSDIKIIQTPYMWGACLTLNNKNLPFGDLKTRGALSYCINRDELLEIVGLGKGITGTKGYPHPESFHTAPDNEQIYNTEKGKELFDKLGYIDADGDGFRDTPQGETINWRIIVDASQPIYVRAAEIIVDQLKVVGIKSHVEAVETGTFNEIVNIKGNYDMSIGEFVPHGLCDDDMMMVLQYGEKKTDMMPYEERDKALEAWKAVSSKEDRLNASYHIQKLINKYPKRVMLWYPYGFFAYNKNSYDNYSIIRGENIYTLYSFIPNKARKGYVLE